MPPGLKPGQKHSGSFQKGYDPRRELRPKHVHSAEFKGLAKVKAPHALEKIWEFAEDESLNKRERFTYYKYVIEQGYGKPTTPIDVAVDETPTNKLAASELDRRIAAFLMDQEVEIGETIDGTAIQAAQEAPESTISSTEYLPTGSGDAEV